MESIFLFCCRSCLKGEGADDEFYTRLGLEDRHVSQDAIKKAYKKKSLQLHPDRLAQKGVTVTPEHNLQFQSLKEAYDVLSDPKKRKIYDAVGAHGIKLLENPQEVNPKDFIKNFQSNRSDRMKIAMTLAIICCIILAMPVLFCLKADGDIDSAPWLAIWTPVWIIDAVMLSGSILFLIEKEEVPDEEEGAPEHPPVALHTKLIFFVKTAAIVLIQLFVFMHLDEEIDWSWFSTFIPWFVYEGMVILDHIKLALSGVPELNLSDIESGEDFDANLHKMEQQEKHFHLQVDQVIYRKKVLNSLLRIWFAIFLALQLDHTVDWDWGLVMLPVWLTFCGDIAFSRHMKKWGARLLEGIDMEAVMSGEVTDPEVMMRAQHGQELEAAGSTLCCTFFGPVLMSVLLVSRLEASTFSVFIIFIPVFLVLYCLVFAVGCGFCCLSNVSTDMLDEEMCSDDSGAAMVPQDKNGEDDNERHVGEVSESYKPPVVEDKDDVESNKYGTFSQNNPAYQSQEEERSANTTDDID